MRTWAFGACARAAGTRACAIPLDATCASWAAQCDVCFLGRREYGTFRLYSGNDGSTEKQLGRALTLYLEHLHSEGMSPAGLAPLLVALGFARCLLDCAARRSANTVGVAFAGAYVTYMVVFHLLANLPLDQPLYLGVHVRFWMQAHLIAYGWLGLGAASVLRLAVSLVSAARLSIRKGASVEQGVASGVAARLVCASASCAVIVLQLCRHFDMMDQVSPAMRLGMSVNP
jgi:hypothetical protein